MEEGERKDESQSSSVLTDQSSTVNACEQRDSVQTCKDTLEDEDDDIGDKLDISSEQFDPLLVLYSPQVPLPFPHVKCFNNIAEYESFIKGGRGRAKPENVEKRLRRARRGLADPERIERLKQLIVNNPVKEGEESGKRGALRKQKTRKNVLTRMPLHEGSPLGELNRCVQQRIRVRVHIRSFKGLRGVCTGFVVAFDKFWNLAMVDVDETYREPLLGEAFYHEKALTVTRLFQKLQVQQSHELGTDQRFSGKVATADTSQQRTKAVEPKVEYGRVRTRHVNQLFIRGENVLLVNVQQE